jgi:hypothetical protein
VKPFYLSHATCAATPWRSTQGTHIWRDVTRIREQMRVVEEARAVAEHFATVRMAALDLESAKGAAKGAKANKGRPATAA